MRVLLWHGWLLEGSGSNIANARLAATLRDAGHDVLLLCQERHADRYPWIDAVGTVDRDGVHEVEASPNAGARCVLLRPAVGGVLPVFVLDAYEGFEVVRFVDLDDARLEAYLAANVAALRAAVAWHRTELVIAGHAIPGSVVAGRALEDVPYVAHLHGSDIEYAMRPDPRLRALAADGIRRARGVAGSSRDVLERCAELVPGPLPPTSLVPPGVDVDTFRPMDRREALRDLADRLDADPSVANGRPRELDAEVERALAARDAERLDALAGTYDQAVPERGAADAARRLAGTGRAIVGSFGKLIPAKGEHLLLEAARRSPAASDAETLVVGFGSQREWLAAQALAAGGGDGDALAWLAERDDRTPGLELRPADGTRRPRVSFTGRLDHRYAPAALAAMDVLVVPSILEEAFGMVAAEGAAAGALPLVARHSGLAEIAEALEGEIDRPGLFSFDPRTDPIGGIVAGLEGLLAIAPQERQELGLAIRAHVDREWSWRACAERLLMAGGFASGRPPTPAP